MHVAIYKYLLLRAQERIGKDSMASVSSQTIVSMLSTDNAFTIHCEKRCTSDTYDDWRDESTYAPIILRIAERLYGASGGDEVDDDADDLTETTVKLTDVIGNDIMCLLRVYNNDGPKRLALAQAVSFEDFDNGGRVAE